jgi:hypothetical protein
MKSIGGASFSRAGWLRSHGRARRSRSGLDRPPASSESLRLFRHAPDAGRRGIRIAARPPLGGPLNWKSLLGALLLLALVSGPAAAVSVGVGAYGGVSIPVVQDDNGNGSIFGFRVPVKIIPLISAEGYYASTAGGDKSVDAAGVTYTRSGIDNTSFGVNALFTFGTGMQMFPFVGIGSNHLKRDGLDATETGYDFGLGLGFKLPLTGLSGDARGTFNVVTDAGSSQASRKWAELTVGVNYALFKALP